MGSTPAITQAATLPRHPNYSTPHTPAERLLVALEQQSGLLVRGRDADQHRTRQHHQPVHRIEMVKPGSCAMNLRVRGCFTLIRPPPRRLKGALGFGAAPLVRYSNPARCLVAPKACASQRAS
jgi:hypothetical protein